jgi:hypothetical protein
MATSRTVLRENCRPHRFSRSSNFRFIYYSWLFKKKIFPPGGVFADAALQQSLMYMLQEQFTPKMGS